MNLPRQNSGPALLVTVLLMPIVYFTVYQVLTGKFSVELQAMVVGAVVGGLLAGILGFWLGGTMDRNNHGNPAPTPEQPAQQTPSVS